MILQPSSPQSLSSYGFGDAARQLQARQREAFVRIARNRAAVDVLKVANRQENWDGYGSATPSDVVVSRALAAITGFIDESYAAALEWQHPFVSSNEDGEISFEWWRGVKKLTFYVGAAQARYVSSWGTNIDTHMDAGILAADDFIKKWRWFRT